MSNYARTNRVKETPVSDPEITPSEPDQEHDAGADANDRRPSADEFPLPEEIPAGDETVEADTASGGAPEPANGGTDD